MHKTEAEIEWAGVSGLKRIKEISSMYKVTFKFEDGSQVENYATEGESLLR